MHRMYDGADGQFLAACEKAGVKATYRQWRKWCTKRGSAYNAQ